MTSKIPKSTYYDKYGPNGLFTKAAAGTKKITSFFNVSNAQDTYLQSFEPNEIGEISSDSESDLHACQINERVQELKKNSYKNNMINSPSSSLTIKELLLNILPC